MSFSQGWDAGFKGVLIYIGCVFFWLIALEDLFPSQAASVLVMNLAGVGLGVAFFIHRRRICRADRAQAEAEVAALIREAE